MYESRKNTFQIFQNLLKMTGMTGMTGNDLDLLHFHAEFEKAAFNAGLQSFP